MTGGSLTIDNNLKSDRIDSRISTAYTPAMASQTLTYSDFLYNLKRIFF